jgi:hypothetical protein
VADLKSIEFAIKGNDLASKPLTEIGAAIEKLVTAVGEIVPASEKGEKNLSELADTASQLKAALKSLATDQAVIDEFTALSATVAETTAKLEAQRTGAQAAKLALEGTGLSAAKLAKGQKAIDTAIAATEKQLAGQNTRLDRLKVTAAAAGIDLNQLSAAQQKVDSAFAAAAPALARTNEALAAYSANQKKAAVAARELAEAEKLAAENRRKAGELLSVFTGRVPSGIEGVKRFKDAILEMTVAFVGFYGVIEQLKSAFEAIEKLEGTKGILTTTFGGEKEAAEQLKYVAAQADRLGLKYLDLAGNYAKFTAAAVSQGVSVENARQVFETFAEAARVKNLSADSVTTIFTALEKILAKDTVAAGDLFKKLTTELPDVAAEFRKTFGDGSLSTEQFDKILKSGKITSDFLIGFAAHYRETFAEQLPGATRTTTAELARFGNAIDQLKIQVLEGGALDAFAEGLKKITGYLKSDDGKQFAEKLAHGLKIVADGFVLLIDHLGAVKTAVEGVAAVWIFRSAYGLYTDIKKLAEGFTLLTANVKLLKIELNLASVAALKLGTQLKLAAGAIGAGIAGWEIGSWLYENLSGIRVAAAAVIGSFDIMWETIKGRGKLAWTAIFDHSNYAAQADAFDKAQAKRVADFREQMRSAGRDEDGAALPATGAATGAESGAAGKPHAETPAEAAARTKAEIAVQMAMIDEAAKGVANHLSELRGELAKRNATELQAFIIGLDQQLKPVRDEIAKLTTDYGKNADATVAKLRAGLAAYRTDAIKQQSNVFTEHEATRQDTGLKEVIRLREADVANQKELHALGQSEEVTQRNIAAITAEANAKARALLATLQEFIKNAPAAVQDRLHALISDLEVTAHRLNDVPAVNVVKVMTNEAEELTRQLDLRAVKLEAIKQLESVHAISQAQALDQEKKIAAEYDPIVKGAKAYADILLHSEQLTDDQRKALEKVGIQLQVTAAKAGAVKDSMYTAEQVDKDLAAGLTGVAGGFAKAIGTGHGLKDAFHAAGDAFKKFASDFLLKISEMIIQAQILKLLQATEGASGTGGIGGGISSAVGWLAGAHHSGGMAGTGVPRNVMREWFDNAPRYHAGGMVGLSQNEIPAILQRGEEVLARNDARNAANGGKQSTPQHIQVVNAVDHESIVRMGLAAPSNTKVILNLIRANKGAVKTALG